EAVNVDVAGLVDGPMHGKTERLIVVAAVGRIRIVAGQIRGEVPEELRIGRSRMIGPLLDDRRDIAVVAVLAESDGVPVSGSRGRGRSAAVRIKLRLPVRTEAGADGVVAEAREHDGVSGGADDLQRSADAVGSVERNSVYEEARIGPEQFDDQACVGAA